MKKILSLMGMCLIVAIINAQPYKIGDKKDGGIIFDVNKAGTSGLIANTRDLDAMNWHDAYQACRRNLGFVWRIPTKDELNKLYKQKEVVGGFSSSYYWSSNEFSGYSAWYQNFSNGAQDHCDKYDINVVRAVRAF